METVKSRSESPFSRSKTKTYLPDASENGSSAMEQVKRKKKNRNKCKPQSNGKETDDLANTGNDYSEEEKGAANEIENNAESNNGEPENGINNGESIENGTGQEEIHEMNENKESDLLVSPCDGLEDKTVNETNGNSTEIGVMDECKSTDDVNIEEDSADQCGKSDTESGAKKDNLVACDSLPESEVVCESSEEACNGGAENVTNGETDLIREQDSIAECSEIKETSQISVNGSDVSLHYELANAAEDHVQASPDTATRDDSSFSNKITNFLGKWSHAQEQKQDPEVSSSKKTEETDIGHPYLSKVSGRRGIRDRLNSSATVFSSREEDLKTPENSGKISLDDSFRVRTNPPRLQSSDLTENPTLRKFKGKRCLNAGDEPEEEDDTYTIKRRKLEKTHESGLLGSILWSPFKKKTFDAEDQMKLATTESKLSRLLSPFWFWKKTAAGQKGK